MRIAAALLLVVALARLGWLSTDRCYCFSGPSGMSQITFSVT